MNLTGRSLGHYRVLEEISRGGMGVVYRATDTRLNRDVALKVLPEELTHDPDRRRRLLHEAQAASALEHPHIAVIHEAGEAGGVAFIAMELIRGEKLSVLLKRQRTTPARGLELAAEMAAGLARAHERGIVHRDLKPANVMVTDDGHVKIIDFGIAKLIESAADAGTPTQTSHDTSPGVVMGTMTYMSPEQARGEPLDQRSDIFSFGIVLHEMLAGEPPFRGKTGIETASAILHESAPRLPPLGPAVIAEAGADIQRIVDKCLAKDPADRYQGMKDVGVDLRAARRRLDTGFHPAATAPVRTSGRPRWAWAAGAAVLITIATAVLLTRNRETTPVSSVASTRPSVAVLYFDNTTGDPSIDWMRTGITEMVVTDLSQSGDLEVVGTDRLYGILADLKRQDDRFLSPEAVRAVSERTGVDRVVVGSYIKSGNAIRINVRLQDAKTGRIETSERVEGPNASALFAMIDDLSRRIRAKLDGLRGDATLLKPPEASPDREIDPGLRNVTTSSIEAYRLYADGINYHHRFREREALALFERAVAIDPNFASAYSKLSVVEANLGHFELRDKYAAMAFKLADRVTPVERAYIEARYYDPTVSTRAQAVAAYERCIRLDPGHEPCGSNLGGLYSRIERYEDAVRILSILAAKGNNSPTTIGQLSWAHHALGEPEKGRAVARQFLDAHPESATAHRNVALSLNSLGRHQEALQGHARARQLDPGDATNDFVYTVTHFLLRDWTAVSQMTELSLRSSDQTRQWTGSLMSAIVKWVHGRGAEGIAWSEKAAGAYKFAGQRPSHILSLAAVAHLARGESALAIRASERAVLAARGIDDEADALATQARVLAAAGRLPEANAIVDRLTASIEPIAAVRDRRKASLARGWVALERHDFQTAIDSLMESQHVLSPGAPHSAIFVTHVSTWAALGQTLFQAGRLGEALPWFRKVVDSTVEHIYQPIDYVRSFYFLGRIYEEQGDMVKSREAYGRFVAYWKDGDLDRDRVAEAQKKLAN